MKVSVTAQPQALYPDGLQDDLVISNEGPGTVWLGSDTSTSVGQSMPVSPLSSVHWGKGRGLWAVSEAVSNLRIERAIASPISDGTRRVDEIAPMSVVAAVPPFQSAIATFEVGAYESILVPFPLLTDGIGTIDIDSDMIVITVSWYNRIGGILIDEYTVDWAALVANEVSSFVRDVKAQFCTISMYNRFGGADMPLAAPVLYASSIRLAERTGLDNTGFRPVDNASAWYVTDTNEAGERYANILLGTLSYPGKRIYLPYLGQRLDVFVKFLNSGATAASGVAIATRSGKVGGTTGFVDYQSIPVGTIQVEFNDVVQPPGKMTFLFFEQTVGAGVQMSVTARWRDAN